MKWIGRIATLVWPRNSQPTRRVRIVGIEQATSNMDSNNPSGFWYWAKYE